MTSLTTDIASRSVSRETEESAPAGGLPVVSRETTDGADASAEPCVSRETFPTRLSLLARLALFPIRAYRRFLSPALGARCRYYPSCSAYAEQSIRELGVVRGAILAAWRVVRCNPFSGGGLDPVSERRFFRAAAADQTGFEEGAESA